MVYESTIDEANTGLPEYENNMHYKYNKLRNISDGLQLHFLKARGNWFDNTLTEAAYDESKVFHHFWAYEIFIFIASWSCSL